MRITKIAKAIVSAVAAGIASFATAAQDNTITTGEGITAVIAVLAALGITWVVPNKPSASGRTGIEI